jgi:hypothetical protein
MKPGNRHMYGANSCGVVYTILKDEGDMLFNSSLKEFF